MLETFFTTIKEFQYLAILTLIAGLLLFGIGMILTRHFHWNKKGIGYLGLFNMLTNREILGATFALLRFLFVISFVAFGLQMTTQQTAFYAVICAGYLLACFQLRGFLIEAVSAVAIYGVLLINSILWGYWNEIRQDSWILTIYIALSVFVTAYATYVLIKNAADILEAKTRGKQNAREAV